MKKFEKCHKQNGFTLLEILISILILSIALSTVFGSFNSVFSGIDAIEDNSYIYEMGKNCLNIMSCDLRAICVTSLPKYKIPEINSIPDAYRIVGDSYSDFSKIRFSSSAHISFDKNLKNKLNSQEANAEIIYYVQKSQENLDSFVLKRSDRAYPYQYYQDARFEESEFDPILCENIKSFKIKYYNQEGYEYDNWNSESFEFKYSTPKAIKIELELQKNSVIANFETVIDLPTYREYVENK